MNHVQPFLLLADIGQIIGIVVFLLFLVLWVIGQISEANKKAAAPRANRPAGAPPAPAAPRPAPAGAAGGQQADPLRQQMEEFLRRARQQVGQPAASGQRLQPAADRIEILLDEVPAVGDRQSPPPLRTATPPAPKPQQQAGKQRVKPRRLVPKGEGVAQHVAQHVDASRQALAQNAAQLGQRIVEEDKQFDVQLKAKFDHELGALATDRDIAGKPRQPAITIEPSPVVQQIVAMLANPDGARQVIVMNEILRRPVDRW